MMKTFMLFLVIVSLTVSGFAQVKKDNVGTSNAFRTLTQQQKNDQLWELLGISEPTPRHAATLKLLIQAGADVNMNDDDDRITGWGTLIRSIRSQKGFFVPQLLAAGADATKNVTYYDSDGTIDDEVSPLLFALDYKVDFSIIKQLIDAGCDPSFINPYHDSQITNKAILEDYANEEIAYLLEKGALAQYTDAKGNTQEFDQPLISAANKDNLELMKILIKHGADIKAFGDNVAESAIATAAMNGNLEIVQFCVEHGCDVNTMAPQREHETNYPPLFEAIANREFAVADYLLSKKANINIEIPTYNNRDEFYKETLLGELLVRAATHRWKLSLPNFESVNYALQHGADPFKKNSLNKDCIDTALGFCGSKSLERPYITFITDCITSYAPKGYKPSLIEYAICGDLEGLQKALRTQQYGKRDGDLLEYAIIGGNTACFEVLHNEGYPITDETVGQCVNRQNYEALTYCFSHGRDINGTYGKDKWNLIEYCEKGYPYVCQITDNSRKEIYLFLYKHGYNISNPIYSLPPIAWIIKHQSSDLEVLFKELIALGADINEQTADKDGYTPLLYALEDNQKAFPILIKLGADPTATDKHGKNIYDLAYEGSRSSSYYHSSKMIALENWAKERMLNKTMVAKETLRVRDGDSTYSDVIGALYKNEPATIIQIGDYDRIDGIDGYWVQVEPSPSLYKDFSSGWCFSGYLQ